MTKKNLPSTISSEAVPKWLQEKAEAAQLKLQLFLPFCPQEFRQVPNEIVRSALFTCRNRNTPREHFRKEPIVVIGDGNILYQGEELRQDDEAVWMHLIFLAREVQLGDAVQFTPRSFLKDIYPNRTPNGSAYDNLKSSLERMAATGLTISSSRLDKSVNVSLIRKIEYSSLLEGKEIPLKVWRVWIEPEMRLLFDTNYLTFIRGKMYRSLHGVPKKLFQYWSSHRVPLPVKTETLMKLCSSRGTRREFRRILTEALEELQSVGFLAYWKVSNDLWTVKRAKIDEKCGS